MPPDLSRNDLIDAFKATSYVVYTGDSEIVIRIGRKSSELDALLAQRQVSTWTFITACNPDAESASAEENASAMNALKTELAAEAFAYLDAAGVPDRSRGPEREPEPSLLALGVPRDRAVALGRKYDQVAIVVGKSHEAAELVMLE